jgi:Tfp pilus assembly protein PilW
MLVALALFSIVLVIAVGSVVSLMDANRKARTQKLVRDNLTTALESMSRSIREGGNYSVTDGGSTLTFTAPDCSYVILCVYCC